MRQIETDVVVIGAGGAGMAAAIAASEAGKRSILIDRSLIGRGGATVMAQMTVAAAVGEQTEDHWTHHLKDTLAAGRGLCDERLARLLCEEGVTAIRKLQEWKVGWAAEDGHLKQVQAPGHDRPRCVYVDFLNTGPAVSKTLRTQVIRHDRIRRVGDLYALDIVLRDGAAVGVLCVHLHTGEPVLISAPATIIATGGLTRLYRRNSASLNMSGDGYAMALRAGASLIDMEFVQFFPIGHLAPRLIGMDPIMWDPFRYKLGGRLLNGNREEFTQNYGVADGGRYQITRDQATYAITKEVEAGRGSPAGGAYLSFEHVPEAELRKAFGPIIDKLAKNGIDLTKTAVEVAPIAHYHMGGVRVGVDMETEVPNLYCAGEAVGGANGANRLSGNAITEALAFGFVAGRNAAARAADTGPAGDIAADAAEGLALLQADGPTDAPNSAALVTALQALMQDYVGPFRTAEKLAHALAELRRMKAELGDTPYGSGGTYDSERLDWFDLRTMLVIAEAVTLSAQARTESRGAHQREDHPGLEAAWEVNQVIRLAEGTLSLERLPVIRETVLEAAS
ncbi:MAG: FAD-binding protein [Alphaproteobacteria bacterium]|nr:FAD-binding protein [Alphaproteobacteria bacterium]MBU0798760.1 FAD-binding protein [Alphaproteobacteria bacterium]MBU0886023.1 FAD-binding protein [Alphaproteobacteria bacterium]MBU1812012.1 FAD-binding protein [Alphaproteobacteria bacterium]